MRLTAPEAAGGNGRSRITYNRKTHKLHIDARGAAIEEAASALATLPYPDDRLPRELLSKMRMARTRHPIGGGMAANDVLDPPLQDETSIYGLSKYGIPIVQLDLLYDYALIRTIADLRGKTFEGLRMVIGPESSAKIQNALIRNGFRPLKAGGTEGQGILDRLPGYMAEQQNRERSIERSGKAGKAEPPVGAGEYLDHRLDNALLKLMFDTKPMRRFWHKEKGTETYWIGKKNHLSCLDIFNELASVNANNKPVAELSLDDKFAIAEQMIKMAAEAAGKKYELGDLIRDRQTIAEAAGKKYESADMIKDKQDIVGYIERGLANQAEHASRKSGKQYIMAAFGRNGRDKLLITEHALDEQQIHTSIEAIYLSMYPLGSDSELAKDNFEKWQKGEIEEIDLPELDWWRKDETKDEDKNKDKDTIPNPK